MSSVRHEPGFFQMTLDPAPTSLEDLVLSDGGQKAGRRPAVGGP